MALRYFRTLLYQCFNCAALQEQNEDTEPEESSNENQVLLLPLRALHELLGADYFIIMCVHTVIGNQVIVRGINQQFVSAIVNTLSKLLPLGCSRVVTGSTVT